MTAEFVFQSTKFNFNIATRGQHVTWAGNAEPDLLLILSTDELVKSEFLKVSVIHLQVFPVMFSL